MVPSEEPTNVRLARIEEGLVHLHGKVDDNHSAVMGALVPHRKRVDKHETDITILKRDRYWLFLISGFAFTTAAYALVEYIRA